MRKTLLNNVAFRRAWSASRGWQLDERYKRWQRHYEKEAARLGITYDPTSILKELVRLSSNRSPKIPGQIHSLIMTVTRNWALAQVYELQEIGRVSVFDWEQYGVRESDPDLQKKVPALNSTFFDFVRSAHEKQPLDWVLVTCTGNLILKDTIRRIREELGIPVVNQWFDCKQNFSLGLGPHGQDLGQRDIAKEFDLVWTSSRSVCEWYMVEGGRPLYLPLGFSPRLTPRQIESPRWDVGFLGARYGRRPDVIATLRKSGLRVKTAGGGWDTNSEIPNDEGSRFYAQSRVSLGMSEMGYSSKLMTMKARDFDVPGVGGVYLTSYNLELEDWFDVGKEIHCYSSRHELTEKAHALVNDPEERTRISERAYRRAMNEHRWKHRFAQALETLGVLMPTARPESADQ